MRKMTALLALVMTSSGFPGVAAADTCELHIEANDQIQFNKSELVVPADCDTIALTLEHTGELPVEVMGHNWTLTRTADWKTVAQAGAGAGLENEYLPQDEKKELIIAYTDMIGGGETTGVTIDVSELEKGGDYTYFCSFPGHWATMNGKLVVE